MKEKIMGIVETLCGKAKDHSPEILTGVAIAGAVTSVILSVRATIKADELIEEKKFVDETDTLEVKEVVKTTWKLYIPTALSLLSAIAAMILSTKEGYKRAAALSAAYSLSESALSAYRDKLKEELSDEDYEKIKKKADEQCIRNGITFAPRAKDGCKLCYDLTSGGYFYSEPGATDFSFELAIKEAIVKFNTNLDDDVCLCVNEFFSMIDERNSRFGDIMVVDREHSKLSVEFGSILDENREPHLTIRYDDCVIPKYGYSYR